LVDEELNQNQDPIPEGEESTESEASRITELESLIAQKDEELTEANRCITELEQTISDSAEKYKAISDSLAEALANYKVMVVQANPEVPEELISGDSIETINESLSKAKAMVSRVRQGLEVEIQAAKIPVGAPQRTPPDLSALSPREKIQYGIGGKK